MHDSLQAHNNRFIHQACHLQQLPASLLQGLHRAAAGRALLESSRLFILGTAHTDRLMHVPNWTSDASDAVVDVTDSSAATLTLSHETLLKHDAIVPFSFQSYADRTSLGHLLAKNQKSGGSGIVVSGYNKCDYKQESVAMVIP